MNTSMNPDQAPPHPTFVEAMLYWLKLGFISFGGPAGQISLMHQELVEVRRWISERRFLHALNYCMVLPGPEAQQLAIYTGWLLHGLPGGLVAGSLFVLPSFFLLSGLSWAYLTLGDWQVVQGLFNGIKPAVVAIVVFAAWRIGARALKNGLLRSMAVIAFLAIFALQVPFPVIVLGAGMIGLVGGRLRPDLFTIGGHGPAEKSYGRALIDDDSAPPDHIRFSVPRLVLVLLGGFTLWLGGMLLLLPVPALFDMAEFFTKAALLTFGGAYAVLPYVYQGGVEEHHWLTALQMMDGLALGETTPGPLIMVVTFVGFVGGWTLAILGPDALFLSALAGATVATFFTFLPGFLFILAGGPLVEATHGNLKFTAPLTGITASVVGVVMNLAVFFGWRVLWPTATPGAPFSGGFEWFYALMSTMAFLALWRFRVDIVKVIAASAVVGLAYTILR